MATAPSKIISRFYCFQLDEPYLERVSGELVRKEKVFVVNSLVGMNGRLVPPGKYKFIAQDTFVKLHNETVPASSLRQRSMDQYVSVVPIEKILPAFKAPEYKAIGLYV